MLVRQLFEAKSQSFSYLLASKPGGCAALIDPLPEARRHYWQLLRQLDLMLVYAIDTHSHRQRPSALESLHDCTGCITVRGLPSPAMQSVADDDALVLDDIILRVLHTPGHTRDSSSFYVSNGGPRAVFSGDSLLIRGCGRTDFDDSDARAAWHSITVKLFALPADTLVYPAHDYKGWTVSSIAEERRHNPLVAGKSEAEFLRALREGPAPNNSVMDAAPAEDWEQPPPDNWTGNAARR